MLVDALLDPATDFVIRRRLPRLLGEVVSERSLSGLVDGLGDIRFEVRYHCSRAIARLLLKDPHLSIDRARMIGVIERELSVPPQKWHGYRLLDRPDAEPEPDGTRELPEDTSRFLEYMLQLLSTIVPREPLDAAVHGVHSPHAGVRGLATEYLDQVLPPAVLARMRELFTQHDPYRDHRHRIELGARHGLRAGRVESPASARGIAGAAAPRARCRRARAADRDDDGARDGGAARLQGDRDRQRRGAYHRRRHRGHARRRQRYAVRRARPAGARHPASASSTAAARRSMASTGR